MSEAIVIVTGGNKGYGQAIASQFIQKFPEIDVVLTSRGNTKETEELLKSKGHKGQVQSYSIDMSDLENLDARFDSLLSSLDGKSYKRAYLIHNSGSIGEAKTMKNLTSLKTLQTSIDANLTSCAWLTTRFLKKVSHLEKAYIVNISSGAANTPQSTWSDYCTNKAARVMLMKVVAVEEDPARVRVLSWGPGVMHTGLQDELQARGEESSVKSFLGRIISQEGKATTVDESAEELLKVLTEDAFTSGEAIDLYTRRPDLGSRLRS
eukprot:TRINITY_DN1690_c0_g1_i1.p1 TRINITY_DN1690_c0_g1~~TRINITY_DN1690_c0_g1_i1.p1  ORF type:complete len:265 (-),score=73.50 TRINITY_DN1690_c0_g1_i1:93-887(-)